MKSKHKWDEVFQAHCLISCCLLQATALPEAPSCTFGTSSLNSNNVGSHGRQEQCPITGRLSAFLCLDRGSVFLLLSLKNDHESEKTYFLPLIYCYSLKNINTSFKLKMNHSSVAKFYHIFHKKVCTFL